MEETQTAIDPPATWPKPEAVIAAFRLPPVAGVDITPVGRAWSNRVFRLQVGGRSFALKELRNPWQSPRWLEWVEASFRFELAAIAAGVQAPVPLPNPDDDSPVAWVERQGEPGTVAVRLHHWLDGRPCPLSPVEPSLADWAGATLAVLHGLGVVPPDRSLFPSPTTDTADDFPALIAEATARRARWADDLSKLGDPVRRAAVLARRGLRRGGTELMSHGDIDQKNTLRPICASPAAPLSWTGRTWRHR